LRIHVFLLLVVGSADCPLASQMEYCAGGDLSQKLRAAVERGGAKFSENVRMFFFLIKSVLVLRSKTKMRMNANRYLNAVPLAYTHPSPYIPSAGHSDVVCANRVGAAIVSPQTRAASRSQIAKHLSHRLDGGALPA
jgi:hypothetical protein